MSTRTRILKKYLNEPDEFVLALCGNESNTFNALNYRTHDVGGVRYAGTAPPGSSNWPFGAVGTTGPNRRGDGPRSHRAAAGRRGVATVPSGRGGASTLLRHAPARAAPRHRDASPDRPRPAPLPRHRPHARRILAFSPPSSAAPTRTKSLDHFGGDYVTSTVTTLSAVRRSGSQLPPHVTLQISLTSIKETSNLQKGYFFNEFKTTWL